MPATAPTPAMKVAASAESDRSQLHADYNLHPLPVGSFGHYVDHDHEEKRFHVV